MELNDIFSLIDKFDASTADIIELSLGDAKLRLERSAAGQVTEREIRTEYAPVQRQPVQAQEVKIDAPEIRAPLVGTFYVAPSPDGKPFAAAGSTVKKGQAVCILEAMKMLSEVPSPFDCVIEEVLAVDGELVGFDQPLFRVRKI